MRLDELRGHVVHVGSGCGVQFGGGRDLVMRVASARASTGWDGMAWIIGDVLDASGRATVSRELYVQASELNFVTPVPDERDRRAPTGGPMILRPRAAPRSLIGSRP